MATEGVKISRMPGSMKDDASVLIAFLEDPDGYRIEVTQRQNDNTMRGLKPYRTLNEFYPFYLSEHTSRTSCRSHFLGTSIALVLVIAAVVTQFWWLIIAALMQGYAFAWVGYFFFEHNKPATFTYLWFSFQGDFRLWWEILTGKIPF